MQLGFGLRGAIEKMIRERKQLRLLDIGCGNGVALKELKEAYKERVYCIGMDLKKPGVEKIDEFIEGNALEKDFPKNIDVVLSFRSIHEIGECKKILGKIRKCLAEKGQAFLSIRCQELKQGIIQNLGKISKQDIAFLLETLEKKHLNSLKVHGNMMPVVIEGVIVEKTAPWEKKIGILKYVSGVNLWLKR